VADTITVTYKVKEDGSLQKISKNADKAASSTKKATDAASRHNKQQKGVIGATSNSTKAFSKMTTGITGGLVPAYATLAANVFALTALFGALSKAASLRLLEEGLLRVGNAAGTNLAYVSDGLKEITGAAISTEAAMRSVALATSAGFSSEQLSGLTKVAKGASVALGRDMTDAMDRLVRGTAKLEPEILDELGIMVRLDDAVADYAVTLGKNAKDLTQYERRMAFLNATIDQGSKKFGSLAQNTEVNPYDKLAASFANLAKVGVNLLNVVVEPFVNFLSSNPLALTAAVTMFAGTLVNQIVPAITASADAARNMAKATHKEAIRLAKKTESSFKVVASKIKSLDFAPKSIQKLQADLQAGKIKGKELQQALRNVVQSERLRTAALKNNTKENIAQKQAELSSVIALRKEIEATAAAEGRRGASSGALGKAKGMSSTSRKTAAAFKMMEGAGPVDGFRIAAASVGKQSKDIGKATGALNKLTLGFRVAGNGAKLFGTALLNAIPIIGQLIFAVSILWPIISKLIPEKTAVAEAADKAADSFASFHNIADQLNKTLDISENVVSDYVNKLNVSVGVVDQVASAFSALKAAQDEANKDAKGKVLSNERDRLETVFELEQKIKDINSQEKLSFFDHFSLQNAKVKLEGAREKLADVKEEGEKTLAQLNKFDQASGFQVIDTALSDLQSSGLEEALGDQFEGIKSKFLEIQNAVGEGIFTDTLEDGTIKEIPVTFEEIAKRLQEANRPAQTLKASIEAAGQSSSNFLGEITKLGAKNKTAIDPMLDSLKALNVEYENTLNDANDPLAGKAFEQGAEGYMKVLKNFSKIAKRQREDTGETLTLHGRLQKRLEENRETMISSGRAVKEIAAQNKAITQFTKNNGAAQQLILDNNEKIRKTKEAGLNAELDSYNIVGLTEEQSKRVLEITQELGIIEQERTLSAKDSLLVTIESTKQAQIMLKHKTAIQQAEKQMSLDSMTRATNEAKIAKIKAGKEFTPADILADFKNNEKERLRLINVETNSKLMALDLEFKLLEAQTKLQKERARIVEAENPDIAAGTLTGPMQEVLDLLPAIKAAKAGAIASSGQTQISALNLEGVTKTRAVQTAMLGAATGSSAGEAGVTDTVAGRAANFAEQGGKKPPEFANATEKLSALKGMVEPMLASLSSLGPEGELVSAITAGGFAIGESFTSMAETIGKGGDGLEKGAAVAAMAGQAIAQVGNILAANSAAKVAAYDQEIAAEKKRDGQSAASVAKIKALENKKEQQKRKAFEQNKKVMMATTIANTAAAMMTALAPPPAGLGPVFGPALATVAGVMGAAQLAIIAGTSYQGGGSSGGAGAPTKISAGSRSNTVDLANANNAGGEQAYMRGQSGVGSGMSNFKPAFTGYKHRAGGGYIVGEQGPELFMPETPGEIIPSGKGTGGTTNVNFSISAVDATGVEELLTAQKGNIIGMIREAANEHGELFLETVKETSY
jgi:hypothetical protein